MKKIVFKILIVFFSMISLCSCVVTMPNYVPNTQNIPLHQKRNELKAQFSFTNFQSAYSITNHIGITANYFQKKKSPNSDFIIKIDHEDAFNQELKIKEGELGLGFFTGNKVFIFELYGGCGYGNISFAFSPKYNRPIEEKDLIENENFIKSYPVKLYIQPAFSFNIENTIFALSAKLLNYRYTNLTYSNEAKIEDFLKLHDDLKVPDFTTELYFFQPALTFHYQLLDYLYFNVQFVRNFNLNNNYFGDLNENMFFDFAVGLNISEFIKKIKNPDQ